MEILLYRLPGMHSLDLLLTLTGGLAAALALGLVTQRLGLSPIVGYLLAGIVVGPHTPGFVADRQIAEQVAELGVILLMFGVGLHFHFKELLAVGRIAVPGAVFQSLIATGLGTMAGVWFGWGWTAGVIFGLAISVASTVVLVRVLVDNHDLHTATGHIAVGWLVVEDLFTVAILVLLPALVGPARVPASELPWALAAMVAKIAALVAFTFVVGARVLPWLLRKVTETRSRELFTLTVLVLALGIAVGAAKVFGVSMALGAFLAGMVVGRSEFSLRAASEALPMRDAFAVLFFVSVGMLLDPRFLVESPVLAAVTLGIVVLGKPAAALGLVWFLGYPFQVALAVAAALAQIGEFSFILAALGKSLGVLNENATNSIIAAAMVSISINPLLYRAVKPAAAWASRHPRLWHWLNRKAASRTVASPAAPAGGPARRAVVVGYGPVGQTVARLLRANGFEPTIVELNLETVDRLRQEGLSVVYGDAKNRETLEAAGVRQAKNLILTASGLDGSSQAIELARDLNPDIRVLARSDYVRQIRSLMEAGAEKVFSAEGEVALALTEALLRDLGATPEQIDRERERTHADLCAPVAAGRPTDPQPDQRR